MGKILDDGFEVYLQRDVAGHNKPVFSPPMIKAAVLGEGSVQIRTKLQVHWFHRVFFAVCNWFAIIWLCLWLLALPMGLIFGFWDSPQSTEVVSSDSPELVQDVGVFGELMMLLALWLLPPIIAFVSFVWLPKRMIVRTMKRSKALMIELYSADEAASN